ncbi:MAG: EAL domain-containing protein [Desulfitobacteriaceae bacterium]|nr:EAL domain-containing protein [Desulfitobacteriaceae bacterium]MDI6878305.1 EAL domain-containing protein [Desulfitobacteriaceae bacterium]MDI6914577.1 EAL domain-containing protein [Desulfitobacteriaceae bacterium]
MKNPFLTFLKKASAPVRISAYYALISGIWILFSDTLLHRLISDRQILLHLSVFKGWFFVVLTTVFLYLLMFRSWQALHTAEQTIRKNYQDLEASHEELVAAEEELRQQFVELERREAHFHRIYDSVADGVIRLNPSGNILHANPAAYTLLGTSLGELTPDVFPVQSFSNWDAQNTPFTWQVHVAKVLAAPESYTECFLVQSAPDRPKRWLRLYSILLKDSQGKVEEIVSTLADLSTQKYVEQNEALLNAINRRILAEQPLGEIYQFICQELVQTFAYAAVWIGLKETDGAVRVAAHAGLGEKYLKNLNVRWDETPEGQGAVGRAIRSGQSQIHNLIGNPQFKPWWHIYEDLNLQSIAVLPLSTHGQTLGTLALFSPSQDYFTPKLLMPLEAMVDQIALAMRFADDRRQLLILNTALTAAANAIVLTDQTGYLIWANPAFTQLTGYPLEAILGQNLRFLNSGRQDRAFYQTLWQTILTGRIWNGKLVNRRADATLYREEMTITPIRAEGQDITHFIAIKQDISERLAYQEKLESNEERYREMFEHMSSAAIVFDMVDHGADFRIKAFNRAAEEMENVDRGQVIGQSLSAAFSVLHLMELPVLLRRVFHTGKALHFPPTFFEDKPLSGWREGFVYKLSSGEVVVLYEDITPRKLAEDVIWLEKERAQVTLESIGDAVITTDARGSITYLNPVAEELTGWANRQAKGLPLLHVFNIVNEKTGQAVKNPVAKCLREQRIISLANHTQLLHRDGHAFAIEDSAAPIRNREGTVIGAVLVFHDVSDKRNLIKQLAHQAHHDALTGLPNRLLFNDRANQAMAQAQQRQLQAAVLFLDLDRFKLINDTLGHALGDLLLKAAAERLTACLREGDTVARQGGDEFLILLPELLKENQAAYVAQKILKLFAEPFHLFKQVVYITPSIGIALFPTDGQDLDSVIKHADTAMYHAKEQGRNCYQFYTIALNQSISERLSLENDLRRALEREEFVLYYQPQYDLRDARLCGVEALVRWQHPERGLIPPGQFIPIAEDSGLILPLGEWVLRRACTQNQQWQEKGYSPIRMAVNLSARQFRQINLVRTIAQTLQATGLEPQWLDLEITESMSMENVAFSITILQQLKDMGIRISVDDFGTGFSSLSYLSRFPLDTLKIDQSFVQTIAVNPDSNEIVTAIIRLARSLGLKVIAEGVETDDQLSFLRQKQCDEVQGYLLGKPVPAGEMEKHFIGNRSIK